MYQVCFHKFPKEKRVHLPFSRSSVKLTLYDAKKVVQALLTDPRITDDDYLFFDDSPLGQPPEMQEMVEISTLVRHIVPLTSN